MSNDPYRVIMTGSGDWTDDRLVWGVMRQIFDLHNEAEVTWVHGGAPGLDTIVANIVATSTNVFFDRWKQECHLADWKMGRQAGLWRNTHMVNLDARLCCAFINPCSDARCSRRFGSDSIAGDHGSHGTLDCAAKAETAGIETWRFNRAPA